jgi:hypothetical protein
MFACLHAAAQKNVRARKNIMRLQRCANEGVSRQPHASCAGR